MKYPHMHAELIEYVGKLADPEYQRRVWVEKIHPPEEFFDEFGWIVSFFFDDTVLGRDVDAAIGVFLKDQEEADALKPLVAEFDKILDDPDFDSDEDIMTSPKWDVVVATAQAALNVLKTPDKPGDR